MPAPTRAFTNIADGAIDPDSPIDTALMTAFRNNDEHLEEWIGKDYTAAQNHDHDGVNSKPVVGIGDGAVSTSAKIVDGVVTASKIAASAISQSKLKTTTAAGSLFVSSSGAATYGLTGGTYSWWTAASNSIFGFGVGDQAAGVLGLANLSSDGTFYIDERYVQASPPYRLGPLFVFLLVDRSGKQLGVRVAQDPPWAYHGPTDISPDFYDFEGCPCKLMSCVDGIPLRQALQTDGLREAILNKEVQVARDVCEITLEYKDSDINVVPHYFMGYDLSDKSVVLLEPGSSLLLSLNEMLEQDHASSIRRMIDDGYIEIDNCPISVPHAPPGVLVCRAKYKNTSGG